MQTETPEGWRAGPLEQVARIVMGQSPPSALCNQEGRGLPFFQGNGEFGSTYPTPKQWIEEEFKVAEAGWTLVSVRAPVGEVNVASERCVIGRGLAAIEPKELHQWFTYYLMQERRPVLERVGQGSTFDAIGGAELRQLGVLLPPLPEQKKIAEILGSVDEAIRATEAVIEQTRRVKEGLLQELLTKGIGHTKFKQTEIGEIPEGWEVSTVGRACRIHNSPRKPIKVEDRRAMPGPYPYWGPTKILDFIDEYNFEGEFALIGEDGDHFLKWDRWEMTKWATGRFNVNNHAHVIGSTETCTARWFYYYFLHRDLTQGLTRQGANRYKLTKAGLVDLPILVPPMEEQLAIAATMDGVLSPLTASLSTLEQLRSLKAGLLQDLLTGKVRVKP